MTTKIATFDDYKATIQQSVTEVVTAAPELAKTCYLSGTMPVTVIDQPFAMSIDMDWRTKKTHQSPSGIVKTLADTLGDRFEVEEADREFGIYRAIIRPAKKGGVLMSLDLFSSFEPAKTLRTFPVTGVSAESFADYLANKVACLTERMEVKDLFHLCALTKNPKTARDTWDAIGDGIGADELAERIIMAKDDLSSIKSLFAPPPGFSAPTKADFSAWLGDVSQKIADGDICSNCMR